MAQMKAICAGVDADAQRLRSAALVTDVDDVE